MKSKLLLCLLTIMASLIGNSRAAEIKVFAAASLTDAMKKLGPIYEQQTGDRVLFNFAGSNALARQIEEGAPADIFFSADEIQMESLAKANLIDSATRKNLLSNTLVIVVPKDGPDSLKPQALAGPGIKRIALADPQSVPAGVYAREYLSKLGLWQELEPKVVPAENVRAALAVVESGNVQAGFVYKTDAAISKSVKVAFQVPLAEGPRILYPVAIVKGAGNVTAATAFASFLETDEAAKVFEAFGFLSAKP